MHVDNLNLSKAYSSQLNEVKLDQLEIKGEIPRWLSGSFISNGPTQFEVGKTHFQHWLDGFSMLKKFEFKSGKVSFQNCFLRSQQYVESVRMGQLKYNEFGTYSETSPLKRIVYGFKNLLGDNIYDNCNVNTTQISDRFIGMTESSRVIEFNLADLSTTGNLHFQNPLPGQLNTAHPLLDPITGSLINVSTKIGRNNKYYIYHTEKDLRYKLIQTYVSDDLFYMHSFSATHQHIILFKSPLEMDKFKLLLGFPFNRTLSWKSRKSSFFILIDRRNGVISEVEVEPFICLHSVNAYEQGEELILDLICYRDKNPYDSLYLSNLLAQKPNFPEGVLRRYVINTKQKHADYTVLDSSYSEFPRINYKQVHAKNYQYCYTTLMTDNHQKFFNAVQKLNVQTGANARWQKTGYFPGEAIFVSTPDSQVEDDGILLFIAFNALNQNSSLVILNASTMQQIAEVFLPFHLPFGLHGNFYFNEEMKYSAGKS